MPRYYRKRYRRRRNYRPRYKRNRRFKSKWNRQTYMRSRNTVAPDIAYTKLKYTFTQNIKAGSPVVYLPAPNATLAANYSNFRLIRGNDVYDPQSTSGTVSATGFQQWCDQSGLYQEFLVHASRIKVELVNNETMSVSAALYPIMESNATITTINGNEQAYAKTAFIGTSAGNNKAILKNFIKTKKMIGCKDLSDDNLNYGQYNSSPNPANIWCWALDCAYSDGTTAVNQSLDIKVDVTYYVQFMQRPVVSISTQP